MCQSELDISELTSMLLAVQTIYNKKIWLFTGKEFEDIPDWVKDRFDVIKTGLFKKELLQTGFPSSSNQKVWRKGDDGIWSSE